MVFSQNRLTAFYVNRNNQTLSSTMTITVFYDWHSPLCTAEMDMLREADTQGKLALEDIHASDFSQRYPKIDRESADRVLHGLNDEGQLILGLDVTVAAWSAVGKKRWLAILRWPVVGWFADRVYLFFAKYRKGISSFLTGAPHCSSNDACQVNIQKTKPNCFRNADEDAEF